MIKTPLLNLIKELFPLKRYIVSDGFDEALQKIRRYYPLKVFKVPTGTKCWDWVIPKKWICKDGWIKDLNGKTCISFQDKPIHIVEYSKPINQIVSRKTLFEHLHTHPKNKNAIPYVYKFYDKTWGFCCSQKQKAKLIEKKYRVFINSGFRNGNLKVGEYFIKGRSKQIVVLAAHLCHPHTANDDLSGVAVGLEVMSKIEQNKRRKYSYLLLLVPETIGSIAWLNKKWYLRKNIIGGIFLEMLGQRRPFSLALSRKGNSILDDIVSFVIKKQETKSLIKPFGEFILNDELEFNSPNINIPMMSLSRVFPRSSPKFPYPEYHTHLDSPDILCEKTLQRSCNAITEALWMLDNNITIKSKKRGQICLSNYGLYPKENADLASKTIRFIAELDGQSSIFEISQKQKVDFRILKDISDKLIKNNLVKIVA